jgi:phosphonate transport system substrate-binding protein
MQLGKFLKSSDDQLLPIRQLELFKQRTTVNADTKLEAADKAKRLAEIDAELAKLQERLTLLEKTNTEKSAANAG